MKLLPEKFQGMIWGTVWFGALCLNASGAGFSVIKFIQVYLAGVLAVLGIAFIREGLKK